MIKLKRGIEFLLLLLFCMPLWAASSAVMSAPALEQLIEEMHFPKESCEKDSQGCTYVQWARLVPGSKPNHIFIEMGVYGFSKGLVLLPKIEGGQLVELKSSLPAFGILNNEQMRYIRIEKGASTITLEIKAMGDTLQLFWSGNAPMVKGQKELAAWGLERKVSTNGELWIINNKKSFEHKMSLEAPATLGLVNPRLINVKIHPWYMLERSIVIEENRAGATIKITKNGNSETPQRYEINLFPFERVLSPNVLSKDGMLEVEFLPEERVKIIEVLWDFGSSWRLKKNSNWFTQEVWLVRSDAHQKISFEGMEPVRETQTDGGLLRFSPFDASAEVILKKVDFTYKKGGVISYDGLKVTSQKEGDLIEHRILAQVRATNTGVISWGIAEAGSHTKIKEVILNAAPIPFLFKDNVMSLDVGSGLHELSVVMEQKVGSALLLKSPKINFGASVANIEWQVTPSSDQWILWLSSSGSAPAIKIWGLLIVAFLLSVFFKKQYTHLWSSSLWGWALFLLPLVALGVHALLICLITLALIEWKRHGAQNLEDSWQQSSLKWNLRQALLIFFVLMSFGVLLSAVAQGLLGYPNMFIENPWIRGVSEQMYGTEGLYFFIDQSAGEFLDASVLSVSIWVWRIFILFWALWLSRNLMKKASFYWSVILLNGIWKKGKQESVSIAEQKQEAQEVILGEEKDNT